MDLTPLKIFGYIGATLLAFCGSIEAYKAMKTGKSEVGNFLLYAWFFGEVITLIYIILDVGFNWPLLYNYGVNLIFLLVIIYYKVKPRGEGE